MTQCDSVQVSDLNCRVHQREKVVLTEFDCAVTLKTAVP